MGLLVFASELSCIIAASSHGWHHSNCGINALEIRAAIRYEYNHLKHQESLPVSFVGLLVCWWRVVIFVCVAAPVLLWLFVRVLLTRVVFS